MAVLELVPQQQIAVMIAGKAIPGSAIFESEPDLGLSILRSRLDFQNFETSIDRSCPDVILIDGLAETNPGEILQFLRSIRRSFPHLRCILAIDRPDMGFLVTAFQCGARGLLLGQDFSTALLAKCVRCVHDGQVWISNEVLTCVLDTFAKTAPLRGVPQIEELLSPREQQVMSLVVRGLSNREIAEVLSVTENTVKKYVYEVFNKTGTSSRVELVLQALQSGSAA